MLTATSCQSLWRLVAEALSGCAVHSALVIIIPAEQFLATEVAGRVYGKRRVCVPSFHLLVSMCLFLWRSHTGTWGSRNFTVAEAEKHDKGSGLGGTRWHSVQGRGCI